MRMAMIVASLSVLVAAQPAVAQDCGVFPGPSCGPTIGHHETTGGGLGGGLIHNEICYQCVWAATGNPATPDHCHKCNQEPEGYVDEEDINHLLATIEAGQLEPEVASRLYINRRRSALQIRSACTSPEYIVAHVPMSGEDLGRVERAVAVALLRPFAFRLGVMMP